MPTASPEVAYQVKEAGPGGHRPDDLVEQYKAGGGLEPAVRRGRLRGRRGPGCLWLS